MAVKLKHKRAQRRSHHWAESSTVVETAIVMSWGRSRDSNPMIGLSFLGYTVRPRKALRQVWPRVTELQAR